MVKFLVRRILLMILTMFLVSVVVFALTEIAPGNLARNTLGNLITPEQEASFNRLNGLDQPIATRYIRWIFGSDWEASSHIGHPVVRLIDPSNGRYSWWEQDDNGTLFQAYTKDNDTMIKVVRQPDGTTQEVTLGDDVWQKDDQGRLVFWGVNTNDHAAMWVKGLKAEELNLSSLSGQWIASPGAPVSYIPLEEGLLRGDPGISFLTRRPVAETLYRRLFNTLILAGLAFVFIMPLALVLGIIAGLNEGKWIDRLLSVSGLITTATPEFVSGVVLILIFSTWLRLLPGAVVLRNDDDLFKNPAMLVLPVLTLTLVELGYILRITRASMVEVMRTNYIRTAVLKGLPRFRIVFKHAVRNALMAPITVIMLHVNWLIGGIVIVEAIFGYPGLGAYILNTALFKDVFGIEAATMVLILFAVGTQLLADFVYTFLNPRIRYA